MNDEKLNSNSRAVCLDNDGIFSLNYVIVTAPLKSRLQFYIHERWMSVYTFVKTIFSFSLTTHASKRSGVNNY